MFLFSRFFYAIRSTSQLMSKYWVSQFVSINGNFDIQNALPIKMSYTSLIYIFCFVIIHEKNELLQKGIFQNIPSDEQQQQSAIILKAKTIFNQELILIFRIGCDLLFLRLQDKKWEREREKKLFFICISFSVSWTVNWFLFICIASKVWCLHNIFNQQVKRLPAKKQPTQLIFGMRAKCLV